MCMSATQPTAWRPDLPARVPYRYMTSCQRRCDVLIAHLRSDSIDDTLSAFGGMLFIVNRDRNLKEKRRITMSKPQAKRATRLQVLMVVVAAMLAGGSAALYAECTASQEASCADYCYGLGYCGFYIECTSPESDICSCFDYGGNC
jgi:hypothetical protein